MKNYAKKSIAWLLVLFMLLGVQSPGFTGIESLLGGLMVSAAGEVWDGTVASGFASGTGTEADPYIIETAPQLAYLSAKEEPLYKNEYIKLANDIVLNSSDVFAYDAYGNITGKADGKTPNVWSPVGGGYRPINIASEREFQDAWMYYGQLYIYENSEYSIVFMYDSSCSTYYYLSEFKGGFDGGGHTVSGLYVDTQSDYQGLFGYVSEGSVNNVGVVGSYIKGGSYVGGLAGYIESGSVYAACFSGKVTGTGVNIGGIVGKIITTTISGCSNAGSVSGGDQTGGIAGTCVDATVLNSFNKGAVAGLINVGGITGYSDNGVLFACYNTGVIAAVGNIGGVVGADEGSTSDCYYLSGTAPGGINSSDTAGLTSALTQSEMKDKNNFTDWDFHNIWAINNSNGYEYPQFIKQLDKSLGGSSAVWDGTAASGFAGGTGTEADPFVIATAGQLKYFADTVNSGKKYSGQFVKLADDITLNDYNAVYWTLNATPWAPIGENIFAPVTILNATEFNTAKTACGDLYYYYDNYYYSARSYKPGYSIYYCRTQFQGTFDGGGHTVRGVYVDSASDNQGFFGYTFNSMIKNLKIAQSFISGSNNVGGITGCIDTDKYAGGILGCQNDGCITGACNVGGLAGLATSDTGGGTIKNCSNTGNVTGSQYIGGGVGYIDLWSVFSFVNSGKVTGSVWIGGVVGYNEKNIGYSDSNNGIVANSRNTGSIRGFGMVGGVVGINYDAVQNCCNEGDVRGNNNVGGVAGSSRISISNCYNAGSVTGTNGYIGGVVGSYCGGDRLNSGGVLDCYSVGSVTGAGNYVGGLAGYTRYYSQRVSNSYYLVDTVTGSTDSGNGDSQQKSLTETEMKDASNFHSLDFHNVWTIDDRNDYQYPQFIYSLDKSYGAASAVWNGSVANGFAGGTGESGDPYIIETAAQLAYLAKTVNAGQSYANQYFELANDIRLNNYNAKYWILNAQAWTPIGNSIDVNCFRGTFDGKNHTVSGIYIDTASINQGLFGVNYGIITNVCVTDSYIKGGMRTGGITGRNYYGLVTDCRNSAEVTGSVYVGGIVGENLHSTVDGCRNSGDIRGVQVVAGIAGRNSISMVSGSLNSGNIVSSKCLGGVAYGDGMVYNCFNTGSVTGMAYMGGIGMSSDARGCFNTGSVTGVEYIGGITHGGNLYRCYNTGTITGRLNTGGIVATDATISNCFNAGSVSGNENIGGIIGNCTQSIEKCYSVGISSGSGVAGSNSGTVSRCYYLAGTAYGKGIGDNDYAGKAQALSESNMKLSSSFTGWDFTNMWTMEGSPTYLYPEISGMIYGGTSVASVSIKDGDFELYIGSEHRLAAEILPVDAGNSAVVWSSENEDIALVSANGVVTGISEGTATITATAVDGGFEDTCEVTVIPVTLTLLKVKTLPDKTDYNIGDTLESKGLTLAATYSNGLTETITNGFYFTPSVLGELGTKTIIVTYGGISCTFDVTVNRIDVGEVVVEDIPNHNYTGLKITPLIAVSFNGNALLLGTDYTVEFSKNIKIGTAEAVITGIGNYIGTKTVTFKIVAVPVRGISLESQTISMSYRDYYLLKVRFDPVNATNKSVEWKSNNTSVATVNEYGIVVAKGAGSATITATSIDGGYTASCTVTVKYTWWQQLLRIVLFGWLWY